MMPWMHPIMDADTDASDLEEGEYLPDGHLSVMGSSQLDCNGPDDEPIWHSFLEFRAVIDGDDVRWRMSTNTARELVDSLLEAIEGAEITPDDPDTDHPEDPDNVVPIKH